MSYGIQASIVKQRKRNDTSIASIIVNENTELGEDFPAMTYSDSLRLCAVFIIMIVSFDFDSSSLHPHPHHLSLSLSIYIYIYIYMCVCVCACALPCLCVCAVYMLFSYSLYQSRSHIQFGNLRCQTSGTAGHAFVVLGFKC